ncbi:tRNA (mo5U34)-methyltransferase [Raoultella planticola]|uniref:tRNA (Mo5U34)-methyltransferase n=1 Tax=Raoultella planticola TaxID=575 RepID=A0A485AGZ8_RAOPL|nr:tRNA (mo5U34)-methyltransferase [Raoultella planticola]
MPSARYSHWLETLPAQVAAWQREALHGKFREWERAVEFLPELAPYRLDLLHSVTAESETPLSEGHRLRVENLLKNLMALAQRAILAVRREYRYRMAF